MSAKRDDYTDLAAIFRRLWPGIELEDGAHLAVLAAYLSPSDEHQQNLALRRLVDDYRLEHEQGCVCPLCVRARTLLKERGPLAQQALPLDETPPLKGAAHHADGRVERLDEAGLRTALASLPAEPERVK